MFDSAFLEDCIMTKEQEAILSQGCCPNCLSKKLVTNYAANSECEIEMKYCVACEHYFITHAVNIY